MRFFLSHTDAMKNRASIIAGYAAIAIVGVLIIIKAYAYYASGALSILSSLTDSVLDSIVSLMVLGSLYYARKPADEDHRWGHGKMEAVSALFQSAIIAGGAAFLVFTSILHITAPPPITHHQTGMVIMGISIVLSIALVAVQRISLKRENSLAIEADSAHYSGDVFINLGALLVLYLSASAQAPLWLDPLFAVLVACFMLYLVIGIAGKSMDMLLDRELPKEERAKLIKIIESHDKVIGWHDLRTNSHGSYCVMSFDIEVDPDLSLWVAHAITKDLEEEILTLYPQADILIHVDPEGYIEDARHKVKGVHTPG